MAAYTKFNQFVQDLCTKVHNVDTDTLKIMLTNTPPAATNAVKADISEIAAEQNIDGVLAGTASTNAANFAALVHAFAGR